MIGGSEMNSFLVLGLGRFGRHIAKKLTEQDGEVLAVDIKEERVNACMKFVTDAQIGDCTDPDFIDSLGVRNFDMVIVAIGDDFQSSLETTALVKEKGAKHVFARANRDIHKKFLLRNGADSVIYPERETAERLAVKLGSNHILDYFRLDDDYSIYEITVPRSWEGKTILEKNVRQKYNISIIAIKYQDRFMPVFSPNHVFERDQTLLVMGDEESVMKITR